MLKKKQQAPNVVICPHNGKLRLFKFDFRERGGEKGGEIERNVDLLFH